MDEQYTNLFEKSFKRLLIWEGGYVNHPNDPGGETKFGITKRSYPDINIKMLTEENAKKIYWNDWWMEYKYQEIKHGLIAAKTFDFAVNMGPSGGHKCLQRAIKGCGFNIVVDGVLGPITRQHAASCDPEKIFPAMCVAAELHYRSISKNTSDDFIKGWLNRAYSRHWNGSLNIEERGNKK